MAGLVGWWVGGWLDGLVGGPGFYGHTCNMSKDIQGYGWLDGWLRGWVGWLVGGRVGGWLDRLVSGPGFYGHTCNMRKYMLDWWVVGWMGRRLMTAI